MTGMNKPADTGGPIPDWRKRLQDDLGEDPGRFLDTKLVETGASHTAETNQMLVRARIRGIDSKKRAKAWLAVERRLDRGPRDTVVEWIQERIDWLDEHGDREERLDLEAAAAKARPVEKRTAEDYENMATKATKTTCEVLWGTPTERLAERARQREREAEEDDVDDSPLADELEDFAGAVAVADGGDNGGD